MMQKSQVKMLRQNPIKPLIMPEGSWKKQMTNAINSSQYYVHTVHIVQLTSPPPRYPPSPDAWDGEGWEGGSGWCSTPQLAGPIPPHLLRGLHLFIDGQVRLVRLVRWQTDNFRFVSSSTNGQSTNFCLHDEQRVHGLRKIA